jgi:hypothetical protein
MIDSYVGGTKRSTFVSATVDLGGVTVEQFRIEQLKVGLEVSAAAVQNALCRQEITEEVARSRIAEFKENYEGFIKKLEEKQQAQVEDFLEGETKAEGGEAPPTGEPT